MEDIVKQYKDNGFYIFRSVFDKATCDELKRYLDILEVKRWIPFSKVPWGWGSLIDKRPFVKLVNNRVLNNSIRLMTLLIKILVITVVNFIIISCAQLVM